MYSGLSHAMLQEREEPLPCTGSKTRSHASSSEETAEGVPTSHTAKMSRCLCRTHLNGSRAHHVTLINKEKKTMSFTVKKKGFPPPLGMISRRQVVGGLLMAPTLVSWVFASNPLFHTQAAPALPQAA